MDREASEGSVISYVHHNKKLGVLLVLNCETDFVAGNEVFQELGKNIAMHIAAMNPQYIKAEDVPQDVIDQERETQHAALKEEAKLRTLLIKFLKVKSKSLPVRFACLNRPMSKSKK